MTELMEALDKLTKWIKVLETSSHRLLCYVLKVSIPLLYALPPDRNGRLPLSRALSVASILADLQMNAEVISAGILRVVIEAHVITVDGVKNQIDTGIGDLLFKCSQMWRLKSIVMDVSDLLRLHSRDPSSPTLGGVIEDVGRNGVFLIPDKNKGERISMQQLRKVMEEHGAVREDAQVLKYLVDAIGDGSLRSDEFDLFPEQVYIVYNPHEKDKEYKNLLGKKLLGSKGLIRIYRKVVLDLAVIWLEIV